jgi:hypothetical protein
MKKISIAIICILWINTGFSQNDKVSGDKVSGDKVMGNKVIIYNKVQNTTTVEDDKFRLFVGFKLSELRTDSTQPVELIEKYTSLYKFCLNSTQDNKYYLKNKNAISDLISKILELQQKPFRSTFVLKAKEEYKDAKKEYANSYQKAILLINKTTMEYNGDKATQAKFLMRHVEIFGKITEKEAKLDTNYLKLFSNRIKFTKVQVRKYLQTNTITEAEVGGNLDSSVSSIKLNGKQIFAKYFVIHDGSFPEFKDNFPSNINDNSWSHNNPNELTQKSVHTYITRTGKCKTVTNFSEGLRATKFEVMVIGVISRGLYIHIELVQPRLSQKGSEWSSPVAPTPGFTDEQYQKLALLYICASIRKGEWLVPAFHANIDEILPDAHDDPQNFETDKFTNQVLKLISDLKMM